MSPKPKLSPHKHTGRYLPHRHTSYAGLAFLIMLCTVVLGLVTRSALANTPYTGPDQGSIGLSGTVPEAAPTTAAVIKRPTNGQHFSATPITVSGTCPKDVIVEVFKNDIFAGSTTCNADQTFSLDIDLLYGSNSLVARVYDSLDQAGPDSNIVTVFYDAQATQAAPLNSSNLNEIQMLLRSSPVYRGAFPGKNVTVPLEIIAGTPPFALDVSWGDNKSDLISRPDNSVVNLVHSFARAGTYQVTIKATDAKGRFAFLTVLVIVNGRAEVLGGATDTTGSSGSSKNTGYLIIVWPLLAFIIIMVSSFWFGERREKHKLEASGALA